MANALGEFAIPHELEMNRRMTRGDAGERTNEDLMALLVLEGADGRHHVIAAGESE